MKVTKKNKLQAENESTTSIDTQVTVTKKAKGRKRKSADLPECDTEQNELQTNNADNALPYKSKLEDSTIETAPLKKKKKQKKKKILVPEKSKDEAFNMERCVKYLKEWKENRTTWKFQKLRQIWLSEHILDDSKVPDEAFPIWLEYMAGASRVSKAAAIAKALKTIRELEANNSEIDPENFKYQRSKMIIQSLDED